MPKKELRGKPGVFVKDKVFQDEPGRMEDDQEGEGGGAGGGDVPATGVDQGGGQVDQSGHQRPGGVHGQRVKDDPVGDAPPEHGGAAGEDGGVGGEVNGHGGRCQDVGQHLEEEENRGKDGQVSIGHRPGDKHCLAIIPSACHPTIFYPITIQPVPSKQPSNIHCEVCCQRYCH